MKKRVAAFALAMVMAASPIGVFAEEAEDTAAIAEEVESSESINESISESINEIPEGETPAGEEEEIETAVSETPEETVP